MLTTASKTLSYICLALLFLGTAVSCVDDEFDTPPLEGQDPNLTVTTTIAELKEMHALGTINEITEDLIIAGVVVSDDDPGNFFRQLYIQDETAGIEIRMEETNLFNRYPVGRRVFVKCKGMNLGDFNNLIQLGYGVDVEIDENTGEREEELGRLPVILTDDFVFPGATTGEPEALQITLDELDQVSTSEFLISYAGRLLSLPNMEFVPGSAGVTFADAENNQARNQTLKDCDGNQLTIRTSGFSDFAGELTPTGRGTIQGVAGIFGTTKQITIRYVSDVDFTEERCDGSGTGSGDPITIAELRSAFASGSSTAPDGVIQGVVISDRSTDHTDVRNLFIQDGTAGIVLRFTDPHSYDLSDEVKVNVAGLELSEFRGLLQVNGVPILNSSKESETIQPIPRLTTASDLVANGEAWEATLVRLNMVTLTGSTDLNGTLSVTDATGSVDMFTRGAASFSGSPVPTGEVDLIGVVTEFEGTRQIAIRNLADIIGGTTGSGDKDTVTILSLREAFMSGATAAGDVVVRVQVISDFESGSINGQNAVIQDETAGIILRFDENHSFAAGTELLVDVSGQEISEFRNLMQLNNVPLDRATVLGAGTVTPLDVTVQTIIDNFEDYESRLVRVLDATLVGGPTYADGPNLRDDTGTILLYTRGGATFGGENIATGEVNVTAMVTQFEDTKELVLRNLDDIE